MNIEGEIEVSPLTPKGGIMDNEIAQKLNQRDAIGISNTNEIEIKANDASKFLVMEIPMNV